MKQLILSTVLLLVVMQVAKKFYVPWVKDKNSRMRKLHISSVDNLIANSTQVDANAKEYEDGNFIVTQDFSITSYADVDFQHIRFRLLFLADHYFCIPVLQANDPVGLLLLPGIAPCIFH